MGPFEATDMPAGLPMSAPLAMLRTRWPVLSYSLIAGGTKTLETYQLALGARAMPAGVPTVGAWMNVELDTGVVSQPSESLGNGSEKRWMSPGGTVSATSTLPGASSMATPPAVCSVSDR